MQTDVTPRKAPFGKAQGTPAPAEDPKLKLGARSRMEAASPPPMADGDGALSSEEVGGGERLQKLRTELRREQAPALALGPNEVSDTMRSRDSG
mmetsp:Transcript_31509/g.36391  ORF Transcript_31509/g.36391 Transcript_31509/m.36391 type:complete len:94 (-) Transcript_31509:150-431(-)